MQILAFGDSITYGSHVSVGWADQLRSFFFEAFHAQDPDGYPRMYNLGIPGETTDGLAKRFEAEAAARFRSKYGSAIILLAYGSNDSARQPDSSEYMVPLERYEGNLLQALESALKLTDRIALLAAPPIIEGLSAPGEKTRTNLDIRRYNATLTKLASQHNLAYLDVYGDFMERNYPSFLNDDGIHPNAAGHGVIGKKVQEYLLEQLAVAPISY